MVRRIESTSDFGIGRFSQELTGKNEPLKFLKGLQDIQ